MVNNLFFYWVWVDFIFEGMNVVQKFASHGIPVEQN